MKKNLKIIFVIAIATIILVFIFNMRSLKMKGTTLLSWEIGNENSQVLKTYENKLNIKRIFQYISPDEFKSGSLDSFLSQMKEKEISVYAMDGGYYWGTTDYGYEELLAFVDTIYEYNISHPKSKMEGIVLDVEPAGDPEWKNNESLVMKKFEDNIIKAYEYAGNKDLDVVICVPNWYDENHETELRGVISNGCDEVAVMNYSRGKEISKIETEVLIAKEFGKPIINIFEFAEPDNNNVSAQITYYNEGINAAVKVFQEINEHFNYKPLSAGWHELKVK